MKSKFRTAALVATLLVAALVLTGCEASVSTGSQKSTLESAITKQLPGKVAGQVKDPQVEKTSCVEASEGKFDCIATMTHVVKGQRVSTDVGIAGTCDAKDCVWETKK